MKYFIKYGNIGDPTKSTAARRGTERRGRWSCLIPLTCFKSFFSKELRYQSTHVEQLFFFWPQIRKIIIIIKKAFSNKVLQNQAGWSSLCILLRIDDYTLRPIYYITLPYRLARALIDFIASAAACRSILVGDPKEVGGGVVAAILLCRILIWNVFSSKTYIIKIWVLHNYFSQLSGLKLAKTLLSE